MLDRQSSEPLYRQLAKLLQRQIDAGEFVPGSKLPAELTLMAQHGVSRVTVRQATSLLQQHGKVVARRGKGTYVAQRVVQHDLDALQGFYDGLRQQGVEPQMQLLEFSPDAGAFDASIPVDVDLPVRLQRLYSVDDAPFALVVGYLPREAAAIGRAHAVRLTVYQIVQEYLGRRIARAEVTIRCQQPPPEIARRLNMKPGLHALVMERRSYSEAGGTCEFMRIHIVPERSEFRLSVSGGLEILRAVHPRAVDAATSQPPTIRSHHRETLHENP